MTEPTHEEQVAALRMAIYRVEQLGFDDVECLCILLARLEVDQWRPIEEAPRIYGSGTDLELTNGKSLWIGCIVYFPDGVTGLRWQTTEYRYVQPTHWRPKRPLPAPPSSRQAREGKGERISHYVNYLLDTNKWRY